MHEHFSRWCLDHQSMTIHFLAPPEDSACASLWFCPSSEFLLTWLWRCARSSSRLLKFKLQILHSALLSCTFTCKVFTWRLRLLRLARIFPQNLHFGWGGLRFVGKFLTTGSSVSFTIVLLIRSSWISTKPIFSTSQSKGALRITFWPRYNILQADVFALRVFWGEKKRKQERFWRAGRIWSLSHAVCDYQLIEIWVLPRRWYDVLSSNSSPCMDSVWSARWCRKLKLFFFFIIFDL